jgi:hypothetical protein
MFSRSVFVVVGLAVDEHDDVGVLLDGTGVAQVGELRDGWVARFDGTRELRQGNDRDVEFAGQTLQATRDFGDFLLAAVRAAGAAGDELEVVDDDRPRPCSAWRRRALVRISMTLVMAESSI